MNRVLIEKWAVFNLNQLFRHMSVALSTWAGTCYVDGRFQWKTLGMAIVAGAIIPTAIVVFKRGIPCDDSDISADDEMVDSTQTKP